MNIARLFQTAVAGIAIAILFILFISLLIGGLATGDMMMVIASSIFGLPAWWLYRNFSPTTPPANKQNLAQPASPTRPQKQSQITIEVEVTVNYPNLGEAAQEVIDAANRAEWDYARRQLQRIAYRMTGKGVSKAEKDDFKRLMTWFVSQDPLYRELTNRLLPIIEQQDGILQSTIYPYVPDYDIETVRYVLYFASELGDVIRIKKGRSYQLHLPPTKRA